jgi:hypothetical protein
VPSSPGFARRRYRLARTGETTLRGESTSRVTFFSERFGVREARAAGFDVYLRTPIDPTDVVHIVATLVNRRRPPSR